MRYELNQRSLCAGRVASVFLRTRASSRPDTYPPIYEKNLRPKNFFSAGGR